MSSRQRKMGQETKQEQVEHGLELALIIFGIN
jgi:hypothetical protein